ncbi:MAG: tetratricopeptide repeat protein [Alphaproteobacteria bacterium]
MKNSILGIVVLIFLGFFSPGAAIADIEKAISATQAGDFETAYAEFLESANAGNADAQLNLGIMYLLGDSSYPEESEFGTYVIFFLHNDTSGTLVKSFYPGWFGDKVDDLSLEGVGVPFNNKEALRLFHLAADQGNRFAEYNLGIMYTQGFGTQADYQKALGWYRRAAEQWYARAQTVIGTAYRYGGFDLPVDMVEAVRWLDLAAEQGEGDAQTYLGYIYGTGEGVSKDLITAYVWYSLGALNGNLNATGTVEFIGEELSPDEIAEVERLTEKWLEEHQ